MEAYIESVREQALNLAETAQSVILAEKKAKGYTNKDLANISGIAEDAIKRFLADKTHKNPGIYIVITLSISLGLDLNDVFGYTPPSKTESNIVTIRDESYIEDIINICNSRVEDVKAMCELRLADKDAMYERIIKELKDPHDVGRYITID